MLADPLSLNSATAITAGTSDAQSYGLQSVSGSNSVRSVASLALSAPRTLKVVRSQREKTFKTDLSAIDANALGRSRAVVWDVHSIRNDVLRVVTNILDPNYEISSWVQVQLGIPRGASVTVTQISDQLLAIVSMLNATSNANLTKIVNGEP